MPYYKCTQCHHEFEYIKSCNTDNDPLCDWCGSPAFVLEEQTPLEKMCKDILDKGIEKWLKEISKKE